jgi:hypothetical protein
VSKPSGRLKARVLRADALSATLIDEMWRLFAGSYDHVTREQFERDLAEKDSVIVGFDAGDQSLQGFSTLAIYEHCHESKRVGVLFSGDTMLSPAYWGQSAMHVAFARTAVQWCLRHPFTPLYWFLTSMGYRTYLVMARNFPQRYWPRYDAVTPPWIEGLIAALATRRYGAAWDAESRVIRFARAQGSLAAHVAPITPEVRTIPEVDFLVRCNPDYRDGVELACVAQVTLADLARVALKMGRRGLARRVPGRRRAADDPATPATGRTDR